MMIPEEFARNSEMQNFTIKGGIGIKVFVGEYSLLQKRSKGGETVAFNTNSFFSTVLFGKNWTQKSKEFRSYSFLSGRDTTAIEEVKFITTERLDGRGSVLNNRQSSETEDILTETLAIVKYKDIQNWMFSTNAESVTFSNNNFFYNDINSSSSYQTNFNAVLFDGSRKIILKPVYLYHDGKKEVLIRLPFGYLFEEYGEILGAIQLRGMPLKDHKQQFLWLSKDLDDEIKYVLTAVSSLMVARVKFYEQEL
jgi:hypothetical protein